MALHNATHAIPCFLAAARHRPQPPAHPACSTYSRGRSQTRWMCRARSRLSRGLPSQGIPHVGQLARAVGSGCLPRGPRIAHGSSLSTCLEDISRVTATYRQPSSQPMPVKPHISYAWARLTRSGTSRIRANHGTVSWRNVPLRYLGRRDLAALVPRSGGARNISHCTPGNRPAKKPGKNLN